MLRLIGLVVSIGIADSVNPTTIAPALYLAAGDDARRRVTEFTFGVFAANFVGGAAIALGPGQLLLSLIPHPHPTARHIIELCVGVAMLVAALGLWLHRERMIKREPPDVTAEGKSSALLGATITVVELPTAFPYFAVIAAIVGSGLDPGRQLILLLLFNLFFVLPLIGIAATLWLAGPRAERLLAIGRSFLQRHWPVLLGGLALVAGLFVTALGITGLGMHSHNDFGELSRRFRDLLPLSRNRP